MYNMEKKQTSFLNYWCLRRDLLLSFSHVYCQIYIYINIYL